MNNRKRPATAFAKKSCVLATEIALAMMAAPAVLAQAPSSEAVRGERIEITGTRIPSPNLESTSPVAVVTAEDVRFEGVKNVENLLNNLPQVFADQGGSWANAATGTAQVNLRGLGSDRTLVLVNGKRLPPGTPTQGGYSADLNQIPAALIQRVEVLTGGASAVYGSDAVAGVVNFILRDNFEGVLGEIGYSYYQHDQNNPKGVQAPLAAREAASPAFFRVPGDKSKLGESRDYSLLLGGNFAGGRGNATVFFGYKEEEAVDQSHYDFSACTLAGTAAGTFACSGSSTSFPGRITPLSGPNAFSAFAVGFNAAGSTRPFVTADQFNFGPFNYWQRPSERYMAHATAHFDINPHVRVYGDFGFHDDRTLGQIAPSGVFGQIATTSFENPLLTADVRRTLGLTAPGQTADFVVQRRNIEGGGRQADLRHTSFRTIVGMKGDIFKNWDYDVFMQTGKVIYQQVYRNEFSIARTLNALDVVPDPATGAPVCRVALAGTDPACVPLNVFVLGGITPDALNYVSIPGFQTGETSQSVQGATITGDLGNYGWRLPGAKSGVGIALGVERRKEKLNKEVDVAFSSGDLAGQGGATLPVSGELTVKEFFVEARVPIIEGRNMAQLLSVNGSYRYSDYDTGIKTDTYGLGIEWAPTRTVKARGSFQRAVRAPNIFDLFLGQGLNLFNLTQDPCGPNLTTGTGPTATFEQCARTGITAAQFNNPLLFNSAGQYNFLQGGNPDLDAEKAKTYSVGLVFTPMRNLSATIDYWNIKVDDVISNLDPSFALAQCIGSGQFCDLIQRDRLGTLWLLPEAFVVGTNVNLAKLKTSGVDVSVNYNHPIGRWGGLGFSFVGTYLEKLKTEPIPGLGEYDCAGLFGFICSSTTGPNPEWRHKMRVTWSTPWNLDVAATWRHFGEVDFEAQSGNPLLGDPLADNAPDRKLSSRDYLDLAAAWALHKNLTLRFGINNVFDRDPPLAGQATCPTGPCNGNTFPQTYDALGRKLFVSASVKF